jgi:hypothetical protein
VVTEWTNAQQCPAVQPLDRDLTIIDVEHAPRLSSASCRQERRREAAGSLRVTVVRTNGRLGVVSVISFATLPGTASPGEIYPRKRGAPFC